MRAERTSECLRQSMETGLFVGTSVRVVSARFKRVSELADGERDYQHHCKRDQILRIVDCKRKLRWHKEKIKQRNAQERGNCRWTTPIAHGCDYDRQQKQHGMDRSLGWHV